MKTVRFFLAFVSLILLLSSGFRTAGETAAHPEESQLQQQVVAKEREELDSLKTGDMTRFSSLLADDAVFVDARGSAGKDEVVKNTSAFRLTEYSMENVRFVPVSPKTGLITYKLTEKGTSHGKEFSGQVHVSALWAERQGQWVCLFSQETAAH